MPFIIISMLGFPFAQVHYVTVPENNIKQLITFVSPAVPAVVIRK
jgi:hypothetical protein